MKSNLSRTLIETVVRNTLKDMREDPDRNVRKLVDMALQFSDGRFQQEFFSIAQTMLQNENSPYYKIIHHVLSHTEQERLLTFGMNLGYNSCTFGARKIRENEQVFGCNIPWIVPLQINEKMSSAHQTRYQQLISEGELLGIFSWILYSQKPSEELLSLIKDHPDSVFFLFLESEKCSSSFLDKACELHNLMFIIRFEERNTWLCCELQNQGALYSVFTTYSEKNVDSILNGDLFYCSQQWNPILTILIAEPGCPDDIRRSVYQRTEQIHTEQQYATIPWELHYSNLRIDQIISDDTCSTYFDQEGNLCQWDGSISEHHLNIFRQNLITIFSEAFLKEDR